MRKITKEACKAFTGFYSFDKGNTKVRISANETHEKAEMYLHGNFIASLLRRKGGAYISVNLTLAGWNTPTTRERLNGVCEVLHLPYGFCQHNYGAWLYDYKVKSAVVEISSKDIINFNILTREYELL